MGLPSEQWGISIGSVDAASTAFFSGGSITAIDGKICHLFSSSGTLVYKASSPVTVDVFVLGGGGSSAYSWMGWDGLGKQYNSLFAGGGGSAGEWAIYSGLVISSDQTVIVGGSDTASSFGIYSAAGGQIGGQPDSSQLVAPTDGGSSVTGYGGGGASTSVPVAISNPGTGLYNGGTAYPLTSTILSSGAGAGHGGAGGNGSSTAGGTGGAGQTITGWGLAGISLGFGGSGCRLKSGSSGTAGNGLTNGAVTSGYGTGGRAETYATASSPTPRSNPGNPGVVIVRYSY